MAVENDTAADHTELYDNLRAFLERGITTPGGPDWDLLRYDSVNKRALYRARGIADDEEIFVGISLHADVGTDTYAIGLWMFRSYNESLGDLEQPGISTVVYLPIWNQPMLYWFVANGARLIVVVKVSTVYSSAYAGKFLPFGTPGEYPQPYYVAAPVSTATTRWSSTNEGDRAFFDPGNSAYMLLPGAGSWRNVKNFQQSGGGEGQAGSTNHIWPFAAGSFTSILTTRFRELRENVDGTYWLMPLTLVGFSPEVDTYGDLDGAYAVSGFDNATENTVTIDGVQYLVVQNQFRTARYYYAAIKLE